MRARVVVLCAAGVLAAVCLLAGSGLQNVRGEGTSCRRR